MSIFGWRQVGWLTLRSAPQPPCGAEVAAPTRRFRVIGIWGVCGARGLAAGEGGVGVVRWGCRGWLTLRSAPLWPGKAIHPTPGGGQGSACGWLAPRTAPLAQPSQPGGDATASRLQDRSASGRRSAACSVVGRGAQEKTRLAMWNCKDHTRVIRDTFKYPYDSLGTD